MLSHYLLRLFVSFSIYLIPKGVLRDTVLFLYVRYWAEDTSVLGYL